MSVGVLNNLIAATLRMSTPLILAALGGVFCQRACLFNIGLEGIMMIGSFTAIIGVMLSGGNVVAGALFAVLCGIVFSMIFALFAVKLHANQIICGIGLNLMGTGLTSFLLRAVFDTTGTLRPTVMNSIPVVKIPLLADIPVLGGIFAELHAMTILAFIMVIFTAIILNKTPIGIETTAVGENPDSVSTAGVKKEKVYVFAVIWSGALCALAGSYLSLVSVSAFTEDMVSGRGFTAFSALIFGNANPYITALVSMLFGFVDALGIRLELANSSVPSSIIKMFPYILSVTALGFSCYMKERRQHTAAKQA